MAIQILDGTEVDISVVGIDAEGNPSAIDAASPVTATSSDESIATVKAGPDNASVTVVTTGPGQPIGPVTITITGDGDPGDGVRPISVSVELETVAGQPGSLVAIVGEPRPRTEETPPPNP